MKEKCITTGMGYCLFFYFSLSFQMFRKQELSWENSGLNFGHHQESIKTNRDFRTVKNCQNVLYMYEPSLKVSREFAMNCRRPDSSVTDLHFFGKMVAIATKQNFEELHYLRKYHMHDLTCMKVSCENKYWWPILLLM